MPIWPTCLVTVRWPTAPISRLVLPSNTTSPAGSSCRVPRRRSLKQSFAALTDLRPRRCRRAAAAATASGCLRPRRRRPMAATWPPTWRVVWAASRRDVAVYWSSTTFPQQLQSAAPTPLIIQPASGIGRRRVDPQPPAPVRWSNTPRADQCHIGASIDIT